MAEKFQKKKLNREDHKKMDDVAQNVKRGGGILVSVLGVGLVAFIRNEMKKRGSRN